MSTPAPSVRQMFRHRLRGGPNAAVKQTPGWRWDEAAWCLVVLGWFGTTGRPRDVAVAAGLIVYWMFGPAVGVFIGGNLLSLALGILPTALLPLLATEAILIAPVALESNAATSNRVVVAAHGAAAVLIVGAAVVGAWAGWAVPRLAAVIVGGYVLSVVGIQIAPEVYAPQTDTQIEERSGANSE